MDAMTVPKLEEYFRPMWPTTRPIRKSEVASSGLVSGGQKRGGKGRAKATTVEQLKFEAALTPEKRAYLIEMGLMKP